MVNTILILIIVITLAAIYFRNRRIQDANAETWATASEPFVVISRHHMDTTVSSEAAYIRKQLADHGNKYLKNPETGGYEFAVIEKVYSAYEVTTSRDFQVFLDHALLDAVKQREAFREQKRQWNETAAKVQFGGQTITTQQSAN